MKFRSISLNDISGLSIDQENMVRVDKKQYSFIIRRKDSHNFMLFFVNQESYVYLLIVRCEKKYEEKLKHILLEVYDEIEEDYDEDQKKEIRDVFFDANNRFSKLEEKFILTELFNI